MTLGKISREVNIALPPVPYVVADSPAHLMQHAVGRHAEKENHAINGAAAQADNIFQVIGVVEVHFLLMQIITVTDSTTFSDVKFALYDGTATLNITGTVNGSGCGADDIFYKEGLLAAALVFVDTSVGVVAEPSANKLSFEPFFIGKKRGADTYVQLLFTGDANTDIVANIEAHWTPLTSDGNLVAL